MKNIWRGLGFGSPLRSSLRAVGRGECLKHAKKLTDPKMITAGDWLEDALGDSQPMGKAMLGA